MIERVSNWRMQVLGGLLSVLLAVGYQWRMTGNWQWLSGESLLQITSLSQLWQVWWPVALFLVGWFVGWLLLWIDDQWSYQWYDSGPLTRSVGFAVVLVVVSGIVITSSGSGIGIGLVLSLLTSLWTEVMIWQRDPVAFRQRFLHDIRPEAVARLEQQWQGKWGLVVGLAWLVMVLLMLL